MNAATKILDPQPTNNPTFDVLRLMIRDVLARPFDGGREWSVQGLGMMRTYFGGSDRYRLHVWDKRFVVPNVSLIHDHPWDFTSWIIAGKITNQRYRLGTVDYPSDNMNGTYHVSAAPPNFHCQTIKCGTGGCALGKIEDVFLHPVQPETYSAGNTYWQIASEIHASYFANGSVTLTDRTNRNGDNARVFWPLNSEFVNATSRVADHRATEEEVWTATRYALRAWFHWGDPQ